MPTLSSTRILFLYRTRNRFKQLALPVFASLTLATVLLLQWELDIRPDFDTVEIASLAYLPKSEHMRSAFLGYHHIAADLLWVHMVQVLGKQRQQSEDFEWIYHALDVITTLDPQYTYAYQVGGIVLTEVAHRIDLSNRILEKGLTPNPTAWWLPFNLGYNYFFYVGDPARAAHYMTQAARLPDRPSYVPGLATRMYAEAGNPETALNFLEAMWQQAGDETVKNELETRMKQVVIERDIRVLNGAIAHYRQQHGHIPGDLRDLMETGELTAVPREPFGGEYVIDGTTGSVSSNTHPDRLRVFRPEKRVETKDVL